MEKILFFNSTKIDKNLFHSLDRMEMTNENILYKEIVVSKEAAAGSLGLALNLTSGFYFL